MYNESTMRDIIEIEERRLNERYGTKVQFIEIIDAEDIQSEIKKAWKAKLIFQDENGKYIDKVTVEETGPAIMHIGEVEEIPFKTVVGFISHRCIDYGPNSIYKPVFEAYLSKYRIIPKYGCRDLEPERGGNLPGRIEAAMQESQIFIGFITGSWMNPDNLRWPEWEWTAWNRVWKDDIEIRNNVIGFCLGEKICKSRNINEIFQFNIHFKEYNEQLANRVIFSYPNSNNQKISMYALNNDINDIQKSIRERVKKGRDYLNRNIKISKP